MADFMRSMLVPSCTGLLHEARELESPYLLGCKPVTKDHDRSQVLRDAPSADGMKARLWWLCRGYWGRGAESRLRFQDVGASVLWRKTGNALQM